MIRALKFHHTHINLFDPAEAYEAEVGAYNHFESFTDTNSAFTLVKDSILLGCVGGIEIVPGVGEVWAYLSRDVVLYPLAITHTIKNIIKNIMFDKRLHRMQAYVRCENPQSLRWANILGFQQEGVLRNFGVDKTDYYIVAKVHV